MADDPAADPPDPNAPAGEDGPGRGFEGEGSGGGGDSDDPEARGRGTEGTGRGGGVGDPQATGLGGGTGESGRPGAPGGRASGNGTEPGGVPGGRRGGTGTTPGGTGSGGSGTTPGARGHGTRSGAGGDAGAGQGAGENAGGGDETGVPGEGAPAGADSNGEGLPPPPGQTGSGNRRENPETAGQGGAGATAGGTRTGEQRGSRPPAPSDGRGGQGEGGGGEPATVMDHVVRVAGYWHLEFSARPGGQSGGIPGGMGSLNLGAWGQAAFVLLTVADIALTIASFGGLAAIKTAAMTAARVTMRVLANGARRAARALTVRNLRNVALRGAMQMNLYADRALSWIVSDYKLHARLYRALTARGGLWARLVDSGPARWLLYGLNGGAAASASAGGRFLGFWPYMRTNIVNHGVRLPDRIDNFFHEGFHAATNLLLWPVKQGMRWRPGGQPVLAVINYLDETAAYATGRLFSGRLHALPLAPVHAFASVYGYYNHWGRATARAAVAWSAAGVGALGGLGYAISRLWGGDDPAEQPTPVAP